MQNENFQHHIKGLKFGLKHYDHRNTVHLNCMPGKIICIL